MAKRKTAHENWAQNIRAIMLAAAAAMGSSLPAQGQEVEGEGLEAMSSTANELGASQIDHVSCNRGEHEIRLTVLGVKEAIGLMTAELYRNDPDNFLEREGRISKTRFAAKSPATSFCIQTPAPGSYALVVYHDENANKRIDKGAFGIPSEPWAISNDPPIRLAPPKLKDSLFEVLGNGTSIEMELND
ncbi:MAG: DUF2141 domain-containing protein [Pseudomonadota bacterium]